jgi:hypothetical protein
MAAAEQDQVAQLGLAAVGPVPDVVAIAQPQAAAREAAAAVAVLEGAAKGWRDGAGSPPHVEQGTLRAVPHHDQRGVAGEAAGRFRGNVGAAGEG